MRDLLLSTHKAATAAGPPTTSALVGFDGFVDTIVRAVDKRIDFDEYTPIETMSSFAQRIERAAGLSTNIELVPTQQKLGGNGPIMANALTAAGLAVTYVGSLGAEAIHPVFQQLANTCTTYSIADPGQTDAVEFNDGKIMLGKTETMKDVNWDAIVSSMGLDRLRAALQTVDLVAFVNWTMIPHMTAIWQHLLDDILPDLPVPETKPWFFVDLADPEKRDKAELAEAVTLLSRFGTHFRPVLGLNRKEATEVAQALSINTSVAAADAELNEIVPAIGKKLGLAGVVVHPIHSAAAYFDGLYAEVKGPHTSRPFLTTGAGDNFNSGFCLGLTLGLSPQQAMIIGKATSGFYVRKGYSPSWTELLNFVTVWADNVDADF